MGFFSKWLGRDDIDPQAATRILSDILRHYQSHVQAAKRAESPRFDMLPLFVLICSLGTTLRILELYPSAARVLDAVLSRSRAYYDCLWQQYLLSKHGKTIALDKLAKVYGQVGPKTSGTIKSLADHASAESISIVQRIVCKSVGATYDAELRRAVNLYINGEAREFAKAPQYDSLFGQNADSRDNPFTVNLVCLTAQIGGLMSRSGGIKDWDWAKLWNLLATETRTAWRMSLLTQFDIERDFLEMPDSFYESI